ncbi:MAG: hypothetical protein M3Z64_02285, partial [Verrucomicrobiota bacterium]|nr:hypothetical protein [Verrucomicrobiota bacterium]
IIFQSRKEDAKRFRKWVTSEVLPQLRQTGRFSLAGAGLPSFVRRFNDNWDRTEQGYFSVISELFIRLHGRMEHVGYIMPDKGTHGKELRPDVSVGRKFSDWLKAEHPDHVTTRKKYNHLLPGGMEIEAFQYHHDSLPLFISFVDSVWIPNDAPQYFTDRDPKALSYLPKLLPPSPISRPTAVTAKEKFDAMRRNLADGTN